MVKNMNDLTKQQIRKYKIDRVRLIKGIKRSMYVHEDILMPIIMQSRLSDSKRIKLTSLKIRANSLIANNNIRSIILEIKNDRCKIIKILIFRSLS